ncbi:MAG TPA: ATP-dependent metallopeptidase FtsH/Yme1/Tma family protein [Thioalkalivibrio sp.]|nr:ATP-dependent metallopeptidase FtsH/Yme1/Tma family protein [Thioalkalivibrio sp.]
MLLGYAWYVGLSTIAVTPQIPYTQFKSLVARDAVSEVLIMGAEIEGRLQHATVLAPNEDPVTGFRTRVPDFGDEGLLPALEAHGVKVTVDKPRDERGGTTLLLALLPWIILFGFFYLIYQRTAKTLGGRFGGPDQIKSFLESPAREAGVPPVTFDDVAGQDNAKREVAELVAFLKNPEQFLKLGAEVPRGVLLMGAPGTGKTLLAKALAGEAGVPFFSISGSEFIEVFVGVGASRVRNLFNAAKERAPAIIFIDELDSVGRTRGTGLGGGHDEREQTLNQILAELDGFTGRESVIVLAATNRPDVLDPALLRPGRFDRHVMLDLPDRNDRAAILKVHVRKVPLADDVDLEQIASGTPGFSGADIKNLVNEAAMLAARLKRDRVQMQDFDEARDKLLMGTVRTLAIQPDERHRLAVHEAGHTLVAYFVPHTDPLYKVSIIPRGHSLGGTQQLPEKERHTLPEEYLRDRLAVMLAGRSAEKVLLDSVSSGADDDIHRATDLARAMVGRWGMSAEVGPVDLRESEEHPFLGREIAQPRRYSEHSAQVVDKAVHDLLIEAEERAMNLMREHRDKLDALIALLEDKETLQREDIEGILGPLTKHRALAVTGAP